MRDLKKQMCLEALLELKERTRGIKGICYYEMLLNIYFDLGGRLPLSNKEELQPSYFNEVQLEDMFYILIVDKIEQLTREEKFSEYLLINMVLNRVTQLLETGYKKILIVENRKGARGYRASKTATVSDFRAGYEVQLWWNETKDKILKKHIRVITMESDQLYYSLQARVDYKFLE